MLGLLCFIERLSPLRRLKYTGIIEKRPEVVLSSEVSNVAALGPQGVSFIERFVLYQKLYCIILTISPIIPFQGFHWCIS